MLGGWARPRSGRSVESIPGFGHLLEGKRGWRPVVGEWSAAATDVPSRPMRPVDPSRLPSGAYRARVYGLAVAVIVLLLSPAFRDPPRDSFPLSDYPMFSHGRPDSRLTLTHALGITDTGKTQALSPRISSANAEVLQSMVTIGRSVHEGRAAAFCREVAERVAADNGLDAIVEVRLATSEYDCVRYFEHGPEPLARAIHAACDVTR